MIRRPPRSTLFPSTPLSRSNSTAPPATENAPPLSSPPCRFQLRSEEHTSELQSHLNLVCRLLLEKRINAPRPIWLNEPSRLTVDAVLLIAPVVGPGSLGWSS